MEILKLEKYIITPLNNKLIKKSKLIEFSLRIEYPYNEIKLLELSEFINEIVLSKIKVLDIHLVKVQKGFENNTDILNKVFILLDELINIQKLNIKISIDSSKWIKITDYQLVKKEGILKFSASRGLIQVKGLIEKRYQIKEYYIHEICVRENFIQNNTLNLYSKEYIEIDENFFFNNFIDSKQLIYKQGYLHINWLPIEHIRLLNCSITHKSIELPLSGPLLIFLGVEKISFSTFNNVYFDELLEDLDNLKEIEILKANMPEEERAKISEYKELIESKGIKCTINPNKLKVINADKGLFGTEVIEMPID